MDDTQNAAVDPANPDAVPIVDEVTAPVEQTEELQDDPADPDALSSAPTRPHDQLVSQLEMRWAELKEFVSRVEGHVDGELGDVLDLARHYLG